MFDIKIKELKDSQHQNDGTFLQTPFWCEFKTRHGWTYKRFEVEYTLPPLNSNDDTCDNHKSAPVDTVPERSQRVKEGKMNISA